MSPLSVVDAPLALTDETLVERARLGCAGAFDALVDRYDDRIYRLALRLSRNATDAEEITQEAFLHAYSSLSSLQDSSRFCKWLYRTAVNEALMRKRAALRRPTESVDDLMHQNRETASRDDASDGRTADELLDCKRLTERIRAALGLLDDAQRAALVLRDLEDLSSEDAAEVLGVSPETVRQRAHRARVKLRALLAPLRGPLPGDGRRSGFTRLIVSAVTTPVATASLGREARFP
jgi:RNA polymerase sigma-70 factor (ECF subfamily)